MSFSQVLNEFLDDLETSENGSSSSSAATPERASANQPNPNQNQNPPTKRKLGRLAFHAFLRWVLHYLFMLSLTDMCDDHRFMFRYKMKYYQVSITSQRK